MFADPKAPEQPVVANKCAKDEGYTEFNGNCFVVKELPAGKQSWTEAQKVCKNIGDRYGDLATVSDSYENALFHHLLSEHWRMGRGNNSHHAWINMKEHFGHFAWENTCPVVFSNFQDLNIKPTTTSCVGLGRDGKWQSVDCDTPIRFAVCQRRYSKPR